MSKAHSANRRRLTSNFFSLSVLEVANYIFPLLTMPYLVRVLGPEKYGLISFAQAFAQYFVLLTNYGFNLTATNNISVHREDKERVSKIFSSVMVIKIAITALGLVIITGLVFAIPKFRTDWLLYFLAFGTVIGSVFFPIWLFQGMERMSFIPVLNLIAKFVFLIGIFGLVRSQSDYIIVPMLSSLGSVIAGILSLWIAFRWFNIKFNFPSGKDVKQELIEGWHVFVSTAAISLYTTSNVFLLGLLTNNIIVGYYSAAEKLVKSGQRLLNPISQATFPYISKLVSESKKEAIMFIEKALLLMGGGSLAVSFALFLLARPIVYLILGPQYEESVIVLRLLAFLPFIITLSNVFGIQTMIPFNMKKAFSRTLVSAGLINIVFALIFVPHFQQVGTAISVLITEMYVSATMFVILLKKGILKLPGLRDDEIRLPNRRKWFIWGSRGRAPSQKR